jgi:hypothetical protein
MGLGGSDRWHIATGSVDMTVRVWKAETGLMWVGCRGDPGFSADGQGVVQRFELV